MLGVDVICGCLYRVKLYPRKKYRFPKNVPCELRAPEDFLEWRYNLLDTSATRVIHYRLIKPGIRPIVGNKHGTHVEQVVPSYQKILRGS